ncbi:very-long-chain 3-oxoacyl-CoA reductase-like isoform X2 [Branchiostoma floridae]|uniref:Very-long-chain 3-oxoacyl-CoA reductase-like isoform X2 n=1 Tax=Branchiostoma floridae TaxID=7739 RepID=A0A9J7LSH6_BRAFL|nr:very-long-chain 3-oxoacyl-CoA reductase-like isoform X2 [Branchiostoma floridae]
MFHFRKKGVIINLSSIFSTAPVPLMALYSGTKAFGSLFSESLAAEYKDKGIIIQMIGNLATNFFVATPKSFVRCALSTVGLASNTCGYFSHSLQLWLAGLFPRDVFCNWVTMPVMKKLRQLGMEELQSKKKK